jgi:hypothetical protein
MWLVSFDYVVVAVFHCTKERLSRWELMIVTFMSHQPDSPQLHVHLKAHKANNL